jgi:micrococcal nuclease
MKGWWMALLMVPLLVGSGETSRRGPFKVSKIFDGDTVKLDNGETVRLIGVDAPETHHPELPVQRFGEESAAFLAQLVQGAEVTLEIERDGPKDAHGRTLAYVWKGDLLVNAEMVRKGYAYAFTLYAFRRRDEFMALETAARKAQVGLWHLSLRDGRIANLVNRYDQLSLEGRKRLDEDLDRLVQAYPAEPQPPPKPVSWKEAEAKVGERVAAEGEIVAAYNSGKACFLNFHEDFRRHLSVVIFASDLPRFPREPEAFYKGKRLRVTGVVQMHEGRPEIVVEDPKQVEVVGTGEK